MLKKDYADRIKAIVEKFPESTEGAESYYKVVLDKNGFWVSARGVATEHGKKAAQEHLLMHKDKTKAEALAEILNHALMTALEHVYDNPDAIIVKTS